MYHFLHLKLFINFKNDVKTQCALRILQFFKLLILNFLHKFEIYVMHNQNFKFCKRFNFLNFTSFKNFHFISIQTIRAFKNCSNRKICKKTQILHFSHKSICINGTFIVATLAAFVVFEHIATVFQKRFFQFLSRHKYAFCASLLLYFYI